MNVLPQNLANMLAMTKRDTDAYSMHSMASRGSDRRKSSRFSLRRMFRRSSVRSARLAKSVSELETRSVSSIQTSGDRDLALMSVSSEESSSSGRGKQLMDCPLCLAQQSEDQFPVIMTCHHRSCLDCLRQYLRIEIMESRVSIACPECSEKFHPNDIKMILAEDELMIKYEEFMLRRVLVSEPDARWCPAPDCGYAVIATGCASCPKLKCERPGCDTHFCYHCKQHWHPNQTCDAARAERAAHFRSSSISYSHESSAQNEIKPCPRCSAFIIKMDDGSCNHMTCAVCGAEFCWLCMKEISDLHYLSPSGCTFWGKKPWSRKKKILWQLGTLVGAPVGISLLASIAVPAMIIGIPIWVGRKLHTKYQYAPKHKRNLVITGGVSASILISPILAGFAVGIGVPILLAYVYGVVPISLCRSGGCGVTTTNKGCVRFEFDDDDVTVGVSGPYTGTPGDVHNVEVTGHHVTNPSIGPSIGEMSVGMTNSLSASGSHIDRIGVIRDESDRDSASNRAIAGASLNGSLCGSAVAGPSGFQHRLEVHADISTNPNIQKRNSLSSESATVSLDAKSATVSFGDDASTKALAGSICNRSRHESGSSGPVLDGNPAARAGSPTSGRSVNFEDCYVVGHGSRGKRYKRHSLSVGDRIHEHAEVSPERLSVRSLTADEGMMQVAVAQVDVNANGRPAGLPWLQEVAGSQSTTHSSASFDSSGSLQQGATGGGATGVGVGGGATNGGVRDPVTYMVRALGTDDRSSCESTDTGLTATSTDRLHKCDSQSSMSEDGDGGGNGKCGGRADPFHRKKRSGSSYS